MIEVRTWRWRILLNVADVFDVSDPQPVSRRHFAVAGLDEQRLFNELYHFS